MTTRIRRPEGLSPCYYSMASPDIPDSLYFTAEFRSSLKGDLPKEIKITVKDSSKKDLKTVTKTVTSSYEKGGKIYAVPFSEIYTSFVLNSDYYWQIQFKNSEGTWSPSSVLAKFEYKRCLGVNPITWKYRAKQNDVVIRETIFEEIRDNILILIDDYGNTFDSVREDIENMFSEDVVPSKNDFKVLDSILDLVGVTHENYKVLNSIKMVSDSLGESDIKAIQDFIDAILQRSPKPVESATITVPTPNQYKMDYIDAISKSVKDKTIDLSWEENEVAKQTGSFAITSLGQSKDVRYLKVDFSYGPTTGNGYNIVRFVSNLYYHAEDINSKFTRTFDVDWVGLYSADYLKYANHQLDIYSVDNRGNQSNSKSIIKDYKNIQPALGIKSYVVEYQRLDTLTGKSPNKNGKWSNFYSGSANKKVHTLTDKMEGSLFYRVKGIDKSGAITDWLYSDVVRYDPLDPPLPPKNFRCTGSSTTKLDWKWDASKNATSYEFKHNSTSTLTYSGKSRAVTTKGHKKNTTYTYQVRAVNAAGKSSWVSAKGKTKLGKVEKTYTATSSNSWRNSTKYISDSYAGWYKKSDSRYGRVYQGEWKNGWSGPNYLYQYPAAATFGKHKGLWFFNYQDLRSDLKDKKILSVKFRITRKGYQHGVYANQQPTFWLHNYASQPSGQPSFLSTKYKSEVKFDLGDTGYVNLPVSFINKIVSGDARGIGTYANGAMLPYTQFTPNAKIIVTYTDED